MARPLRIEYPGAFYHVTSRGNELKEIFKSIKDRERFLDYLGTANERYGALIHVYCLMSNHYHIFLETARGNLSQIMGHINGAYTNYFNTKRKRSGHLFQGRYKAILVDADAYAQELSRYIHLNPVRAGMVEKPEDYLWSSYRGYMGRKKNPEWLEVDFILGYFGKRSLASRKAYGEFVNGLIGKTYGSPLESTIASMLLGGDRFLQEIQEKYIDGTKKDRNLPALRELKQSPSLEAIYKKATSIFSNDHVLGKKAAIYISHRYSGKKLREIGSYFKMGESAVSQTSRRFHINLKEEKTLNKKIRKIENSLTL